MLCLAASRVLKESHNLCFVFTCKVSLIRIGKSACRFPLPHRGSACICARIDITRDFELNQGIHRLFFEIPLHRLPACRQQHQFHISGCIVKDVSGRHITELVFFQKTYTHMFSLINPLQNNCHFYYDSLFLNMQKDLPAKIGSRSF